MPVAPAKSHARSSSSSSKRAEANEAPCYDTKETAKSPKSQSTAPSFESNSAKGLSLYSSTLNMLMPRRKEIEMHNLAAVSASLHFLALANALHGAMKWFSSPPSAQVAFDFNLIAFGFYAYVFDVVTALVCGRSFFYRWTRIDVFIHHLPFMFVGGFWALATYDILSKKELNASISYFQQAIRWAMLSCSNECALGLGAALRGEEEAWARRLSTWAGLVYFLVFSPIWIYYALSSCYQCYTEYNSICLWLNTAVPITYAVTQYPLYVKVYAKRLKKLYEIESFRGKFKSTFQRRSKDDDNLVKLADVKTWDVRPRMAQELSKAS